jgi:hypothetical protein
MSSGGKRIPWTPFADEVIETMYATHGARACHKLLPDRTIEAIQQRAHKLRVAAANYVKEDARVKFGLPVDTRPDSDKALDYVLRDFRLCEPAANLTWIIGAVA